VREAGEMECPVCHEGWQDDNAFERNEGSEVECPACGSILVIVGVEMTRAFTWQARPK
jgi:Zn finger protein HypA/HybF involved in hydrogenase expression